MVDNFLNHMMENLILILDKWVPVNEPGTMEQYKTVDLKSWEKTQKKAVDAINEYEPSTGKPNNLLKYYKETVYPLLTGGKIMKQGFHKYYAVRIDDYDFRQMMQKIDKLMSIDIL